MDLTIEQNTGRNKIHPHKFAMWVGCAALVMMFGSLTSAYIVRQAAGNWLEFKLPPIFAFSTLIILLSSLSLHSAFIAFKKGKEASYKILLIASFVLGIAFIVCQYSGWVEMKEIGIQFTLNPSGDFVYVISWLHAAHVIGGIAALTVAMVHAFGLPFKVTEKRKLRFEVTLTYWHFVDLLWVYLFLFFTFYR